jgi:hypothetical protein
MAGTLLSTVAPSFDSIPSAKTPSKPIRSCRGSERTAFPKASRSRRSASNPVSTPALVLPTGGRGAARGAHRLCSACRRRYWCSRSRTRLCARASSSAWVFTGRGKGCGGVELCRVRASQHHSSLASLARACAAHFQQGTRGAGAVQTEAQSRVQAVWEVVAWCWSRAC